MVAAGRIAVHMGFRRIMRLALRLAGMALALAAAAFVTVIFRTARDPCLPAARPGPILDANVASSGVVYRVSHALAPLAGRIVGPIRWRHGLLFENAALEGALAAELKPLDVLIQKNPFSLSDYFIPGYFTHAIVYLGNEAELRTAGLWDMPALDGVRDRLQDGSMFIEVDHRGSHLIPLSEATNTDELAVLRIAPPGDGGPGWPGQTLKRIVASVGMPYDFSFDVDTASETTCAELVLRVFNHVAWPLREIMGRRAVLPDDMLRVALAGAGGVRLVAFHNAGTGTAAPASAGQHLAQCTGPSGARASLPSWSVPAIRGGN